ncbi:MAG: molybdopterin-dependent oxidoreductase [Coriobacteriia bacterium]|nr:molybdopterin-dependent oxidoreductase [Coriobacteriia bacterium]
MTQNNSGISRRGFVKATGALAAAAAVGAGVTSTDKLFGEGVPQAHAESTESIHWSQCNVNCGGNCIFQWHSRDGKALYMETDNIGDEALQARACLRGRSMRRWLNHPDRLLYPMKRVGKRGSGEFERISWDEALDIIHDKLSGIIKDYGNESIYVIYATGMYSSMGRNPIRRVLSLVGGFTNQGADYSTHMLQTVMPYMYGSGANIDENGNHVTLKKPATAFSPYDNVNASSFSEAALRSDLVVMFGNSPAETRMGGANAVWDFARVREEVTKRGGKIINIDYRLNETSSGHPDEWLPIRPGTDAALCSAIAHEWIVNGQVDEKWVNKHCVGYDESTMPKSAKGKNKSYKDYIMGKAADGVEKTPEWAAEITMVPADKIRELAATIAGAKAPFICQGWGSQRHTNGEETTRAICMLPILIGQMGKPGTNTGQREAEPPVYLVGSLPYTNPVTATIPVYQWANAVDHGRDFTATNSGLTGADKLGTDIKCIINYAGNCITNQHGDINYTHELLQDESKCEFILGWDTVMTDSAKYADILLPDAMRSEQMNMQTQGYSEYYTAVVVGTAAQEAPGECRSSYDVCADLAERFGKRKEFTEGKTHDQWIEELYKAGAAADGQMPSWDEIVEQGVYKREVAPAIGLKNFCEDPENFPLGTPSGKIEIYSETLDKLNDTWELAEDEHIYALPEFHPGFHGYGEVTDEFPLYGVGFHHKSRTHSSFGFIEDLEKVARQQAWINPATAAQYGVSNGDTVKVTSPAGAITIEAFVTHRIVPGCVAIPQGSWHNADMFGDQVDKGGCVNTLTSYKPSPLAKGNGTAHSFIVSLAKA